MGRHDHSNQLSLRIAAKERKRLRQELDTARNEAALLRKLLDNARADVCRMRPDYELGRDLRFVVTREQPRVVLKMWDFAETTLTRENVDVEIAKVVHV